MLSMHIFTIRTNWPILRQTLGEAHPSEGEGNRPLQISRINRLMRQVFQSTKTAGEANSRKGALPWLAMGRRHWDLLQENPGGMTAPAGARIQFPAHILGAQSAFREQIKDCPLSLLSLVSSNISGNCEAHLGLSSGYPVLRNKPHQRVVLK